MLGKEETIFVDGGITPYNNPALIAALTAMLPGYMVKWPPGPENIRMVSVGTIQFSSELRVKNPKLWLGYYVAQIPAALLQATGWQQDYLCRCLGDCLFGEKLDREAGYLMDTGRCRGESGSAMCAITRSIRQSEMEKILKQDRHLAQIDAVEAIPRLRAIGEEYAEGECEDRAPDLNPSGKGEALVDPARKQ